MVASCFIGAGEIKGATAVVQTMEKLDVMGQMVGKFAKLTGRYVIRPVVSKAGKFIIEPLIKLEPALSQKLRSNVSKYVAQLLNKDKIHLSLHATSEGKFIVDGVELSPEEFGEYITKKLKETGNANKSIVLLSCNDLESAKALAAVTGKKVYTTDGPMTIFENGIRRADGSEWYEIAPDGTSTKIQSPVTECTNCAGEGVEMGVNSGSILASQLTGALKNVYDDIISLGGSATEINGKIKLFDKNGSEILEIYNGKLLPNTYYNTTLHTGATPIGQPVNGYQVFKKGDDLVVKRIPDTSAYSTSELTELTQHPDAHVLERHGTDVTDEALIKRANEGIAPDGSTIGNPSNPSKPPYSSRFETPQQLRKALNNTKPGSSAFNTTATTGGNTKVVYHTLTDGSSYGKGVPKDNTVFQQATKVRAVYRQNASGDWQLLTMFPDF